MAKSTFPTAKAGGKKRTLNARRDTPDIRDRWYEPSLIQLKKSIDNRNQGFIRDQGEEGACTGFGLAAVVDILNRKMHNGKFRASTRMLYEMAKHHDEWPGEKYSGSSCRGAIRGWKNMGVCSETDWPYDAAKAGDLTLKRAVAARDVTLGAYYRLRPEINEYHAALNEVGAVYVSAGVHEGWWDPKASRRKNAPKNELAIIKPSSTPEGGHAFAIVGYDQRGFIVQNSWGKTWGKGGYALWLYEDWLENITDGWVFRLAVPTPQIFGVTARSRAEKDAEFGKAAPKRMEIAGHFVHYDDGKFEGKGDYWSAADDIQRTADYIKDSCKGSSKKYQHLLIYAHGGLNNPKASATRIAALKEGFKRNGIYPFHIMYDTGLGEEIKDAVVRAFNSRRMESFLLDPLSRMRDKLIEQSDAVIEDLVCKPVTPLWDEMKRDAHLPFVQAGKQQLGDGVRVIKIFADTLAASGWKIHLAGHSTGGVLLGHLLMALDKLDMSNLIHSVSLMAPACTIDFYKAHYEPRLAGGDKSKVAIPHMDVYNLNEALELEDNTAAVYRKSLLYLVSRAFERDDDKPLLGMARYSKGLQGHNNLNFHYSDGKSGVTTSRSHGGFDNDANTMNAIMQRILGKKPPQPFVEQEMKGY